MPELPEVESTVRYLRERVLGLRITGAEVRWDRTIANSSPDRFASAILDTPISAVIRRGKFVVMELGSTSRKYLFIHLRMSGSLDVVSTNAEDHPHDRVIIQLEGARCIRFNDTRKFGRMYLASTLEDLPSRIGLEPLENTFTPEALAAIFAKSRRRIKPLLLDQGQIAGLGNIYVDESLWKSGIHPLTPAQQITEKKIAELHTAIQSTLREAIELAGTDFGDGVVYGGTYRPLVYGRAGQPCHRCNELVQRIVVGQRGTHICASCQRPS